MGYRCQLRRRRPRARSAGGLQKSTPVLRPAARQQKYRAAVGDDEGFDAFEGVAFGDAMDFLLDRAGVGVDVEGDEIRHWSRVLHRKRDHLSQRGSRLATRSSTNTIYI